MDASAVLVATEAWACAFPGAVVGALVMRVVRNPEQSVALEDRKTRGGDRTAGDAGGGMSRLLQPRLGLGPVFGDAGVNPGGEALLGGNPAQQCHQVLALGRIEPGAQLGLVLRGGLHHLAEDAAALRREVEGAHPPVAANRPALNQASALEPVDQCHHATRWDLQCLGQRLLGLSLGGCNVSEQHDFARVEVQPSHPLSPQSGRVGADLGDEEGGAGDAEPFGVASRGRFRITHAEKHNSLTQFQCRIISR